MKKIQSFLLLFAAAFLLFLPSAQADDKPSVPIVSVDGTGSYEAAPDQANLSVGIRTYAENAQQAQQSNAETATAIQNALIEFGIPEKCIQTRDYSFYPTYDNGKNHENTITGYTVNNTITVTITDISITGKVIDLALQNGANQVNSLNFSARNTEKIRRQAMTAAVKDAREKADILAEGLGKRIIGVQNVSESGTSMRTQEYNTMGLSKMAVDNTPIAPGTLTCNANVHVDFILGD